MSVNIHPTAIVHKNAKLGVNVEVGPFSIIEDNVEIGDNTKIHSSVIIKENSTLGENCQIFEGAVIGNTPQHLGYKGEKTFTEIGNNVIIREYCTIHRGTAFDDGITKIGDNTYLMAYVHIAHDCKVGHDCIFANNATLGGHVHVGNYVFLGGFVPIHQFCRVGDYAMIGGGAVVTKDIPPFTRAARNPVMIFGLNLVGLKRRGFSNAQIRKLKEAYKILFLRSSTLQEGIEKIKKEMEITPEIQNLITFIENSKRGIAPEASKKKFSLEEE